MQRTARDCDLYSEVVLPAIDWRIEVANLKGGLFVPVYCEGTYCTFYAVANHHRYVYFSNEAQFLNSAHDDNNWPYTGAFGYVSEHSRQDNGFTMSASKKVLIGPNGTVTDVAMTLKRTVAKIAIRTEMVPDFPSRYHSAKAWIKRVDIATVTKNTPLIYQPGVYLLSQGSLKTGQDSAYENDATVSKNLLYVFENPPVSQGGSPIALTFTIVLDQDGSMDTNDDRIETTCTIPFTGHGDCEIRRNGYYRVQAIIRDADAIEVISTVAAGEWEPPVTQVIDDLR